MRISSGVTDQYIPFYAESGGSPVTGLSSFSVTRARNGATGTAMTTPTTVEVSGGLYWLLANEDMTITSGNIEEEMCFIVSHGSADTVILQITLVDDAYHATAANLATAQADLDTITGSDGVTLATAQGNYAPATTAALATAQSDLDTITGSDGVTLATAQGNYAPAVAGDDMGLTVGAIDNIWDEVLTVGSHNVGNSAGRRLRNIQDFGVYDMASVWVDEVAGQSTGTTDGEDATVTNRSDDFDNAQTVADSVNLTNIQITNGNSITLSAGLEGYNVWGNGASLALGGQNIGGTVIREFGSVTGIGTSTGNPIFMENCLVGAVTLAPGILQQCGIGQSGGTFTVGSAGAYRFVDCYSDVAGASAPVVNLAAVGATTMEFRRWSGGLTLNNVATGDVVSVDVVSGGTITVNGTGGTVVIRGMCNVVDGSSGSVTITQTSVVNMTKINSEVDTAIGDASLATAAALATAQTDLDTITGSDGVTLATAQANYAPATAASVASLNDISVSDILTTQMTESYASDGAAPTITQSLMLIQQMLGDFSISGTTLTIREVDGTTTAATFTLNDGTTPTAVTRDS